MAKKHKAKPEVPAVAAPVKMSLPAGIKALRQVITPTLNLKVNEPRILTLSNAMRVSSYKDPDPKKSQKPATVTNVTDVETGEMFLLLVPSVMESSLKEAYPDDGYVGKTFYVQKKPKRAGKRYFDFDVIEVDASDYVQEKS